MPRAEVGRLPSSVEEAVRRKFGTLVESGGFPSCAVGVVRGNRLVYSSAFGVTDRKTKQPAGLDTMYKVGSVGKVFTACLLLILRDRGSLKLDDPVEKFLPDGVHLQRDSRGALAITFRHLATHTSGLPEWPEGEPRVYDPDPTLSAEDRFRAFTQDSLEFPPGERFRYSGDGYSLLGIALERIGGDSYENQLWRYLFQPLGMVDTVITVRPDQRSRIPKHYAWDGSEVPTDPTVLRAQWELATSAHFSTVADLARFLSFQFRAGDDGVAPISGGTLREMHTPQRLQNNWNDAIGLGWWIEPNERIGQIVWHKGGSRGFGSYVAFSPLYQVGVIVLANRNRNLEEVGRWLLVMAAQALGAPGTPSSAEAERYYGWRDWSTAAWAYREITSREPSNGRGWFRLASSLARLGQFEEAVRAFKKAIDLGESVPDSWYFIARCALKMGRESDAVSALVRAADAGFEDADGEVLSDGIFEPLRGNREFQEFASKVVVQN